MGRQSPPPGAEDVEAVVRHCRTRLGRPDGWIRAGGYPGSLALCVIDSIQSTGPRYTSVVNVVGRYRAHRGAHADEDGTKALLGTFAEFGGPAGWAARIGNRNRTFARPYAPLKAEAIHEAAAALDRLGIDGVADLDLAMADESSAQEVERAWRGVVSQSSGITWSYFLRLAGHPGVKADRMIVRFVADALSGTASGVRPERARVLVTDAAGELGVSASDLDHAIWRHQSGRPWTS
ncbi:heme peroxidase [Geodermatophilus chilensis]|uniref:heme peroxidase n=1 Tax=Geodermatophilus chilensis TaxID=2035835 RepID=UPI000C25C7D8|nr:heme peroxidase [Geodermatophilus chilensis]